MKFGSEIKIERHNTGEKILRAIDEYTFEHGRSPEIILIDVFSLKYMMESSDFMRTNNMESDTIYGLEFQPIQTSEEFIFCQRKKFRDVFSDTMYKHSKGFKIE